MKKKEDNKYELTQLEFDGIGFVQDGFAKIRKDDKIGFINEEGEIVIPFEYDFSYIYDARFNEDLAALIKNGKFGVIDKYNKVIVPFIYDKIDDFNGGLAVVKKDNLYGCVNKKGEFVFPLEMECININGNSDTGLIVISKDGKWGIIDKDGRPVVPVEYKSIIYSEGRYITKSDEAYGIFNSNGQIIVPFEFDDIDSFKNGLAEIKKDHKKGIIDKDGKIIVPCEFDCITVNKSLIEVEKNDRHGLFNHEGKNVLPCEYDSIFGIDKYKYPTVTKNGKDGIIDSNGRIIVSCEYDQVKDSNGDISIVIKDKKYGIVKNDNLIIPNEYDSIVMSEEFNVIALTKGENVTLLNFDFQEIPGNFDKARKLSLGDYIVVSKNGKQGLIGKDGVMVLPCEYKIVDLYSNWIVVEKNGKKGVWNDGKFIINCIYDDIIFDSSSSNYPEKPKVVGAKKENKWGIFYLSDLVLPMEYSEVLAVNQDYPVILKNEGDKQCTLIDLKGNAIFSVKKEKYDEIKVCDWEKKDGMTLLEVNCGKKTGMYHKKLSEVIIPVKYNMINILTENLFSVYEKNKAGLYRVSLNK